MTKSGGSAAMNGFLYQILQHLDWLTEISMSGTLDGDRFKQGLLILEPRAGGDAQASTSDLLLVEQYKTLTKGTWSLTSLMDVLRDLRKAVPNSQPECARYRFVTNGRPGKLVEFKGFLRRLNGIEDPDDLDNEKRHSFTNTICLGDRDFLDYIAMKTGSDDRGGKQTEERELVLHLLRRFQMEFGVGSGELVGAVEARLRPYVRHLGDEASVRERLVGVLMERLGSGEIRLDQNGLDVIFREVDLMPGRVRKARSLARILQTGMDRRSGYLKYRHEHDVRDPPHWPEARSVLLIAGESGAGKSWQLARLMEESAAKSEPVVFVGADGATAEAILKRAASDIWQDALRNTTEMSLPAISNFFREKTFQLHPPFYTVAIDDVQRIEVARSLVRQDWTGLGARLVMTVPLRLVRALESEDYEEIQFQRVGEFSINELDTLLKMHGHRWADLPTDLKRLLRKPVLAGLYLGLDISSYQDAPQSEYEIFQAFWDRIAEKCEAGDAGIVVALADRATQGLPYPLPRQEWREVGLDERSLAALELAGWLSCLEHGEVAFAHDRLLNWAVAQNLSRRFMRRTLSVDELYGHLTGEADQANPDFLRRLGYVAMDTLWLLSAYETNQDALGKLVERMEDHRELGGDARYLYTRLLPTLGQRAVPILLHRLGAISANSRGDYRVRLIGDVMAALSHRESVDIQSHVDSLLQSPSWELQSVAIRVLTADPDPRHLDRLWEIYRQQLEDQDHGADGPASGRHETFLALRLGVRLEPAWLQDRILRAEPDRERVSDLGFLLNALDDPIAEDIWLDVRDALMENVPADKPRCLLYCIGRFRDQEHKGFVIEHLTFSEDMASAAALAALAILDPQMAIERIVNINEDQKRFWNEWLPLLLRADSIQTHTRIRELAISDSRGQQLLEDFFERRPTDLDGETARSCATDPRSRVERAHR